MPKAYVMMGNEFHSNPAGYAGELCNMDFKLSEGHGSQEQSEAADEEAPDITKGSHDDNVAAVASRFKEWLLLPTP